MKRLLGLSVIILGALSSWGAESPIKLVVVAGAGGAVRPGAIAPIQVQVELSEDADTYKGLVTAQFLTGMGASPVAQRALSLEPGSKKRTTLYMYVPSTARRIEVKYELPNGKVIDDYGEDIRLLDSTRPALAAVGTFPPSLPPNQHEGEQLFYQANLQVDQIPERHEGLEMYDALFFTPAPDRALRRDQLEALSDWMMRGGIAVMDGSSRTDFFRSSGIEAISPFIPSGTQETSLPELGGVVVHAVGTAAADAEVMLEIQGVPLIYRRNYGLGACVVFTVDPQHAGLKEFSNIRGVWDNVLQDPRMTQLIQSQDQFIMGGLSDSRDGTGRIVEGITQSVAPDAPSTGLRLGLVLLLTALYALAVGPGDYFLIKKLGRPKLTWITFPTIVAAFTLAAYGGARFWIGGEMNVRCMHRIVAFPQIGRAIHYEASGLFVPQGATYAVSHEGSGLLRHLGEVMARDDRLVHDQEADVLQHRIPIWTFRTYGASNSEVDLPAVDVTIRGTGESREATVTNRSDVVLRGASLSGQWAGNSIGNVAPGQTVTVPLERRKVYVRQGDDVWSGGMNLNQQYPSMMREFTANKAFQRGAVMLDCSLDPMPTTLTVDGATRQETGPVRLQVVVYPEPHPMVLEEER